MMLRLKINVMENDRRAVKYKFYFNSFCVLYNRWQGYFFIPLKFKQMSNVSPFTTSIARQWTSLSCGGDFDWQVCSLVHSRVDKHVCALWCLLRKWICVDSACVLWRMNTCHWRCASSLALALFLLRFVVANNFHPRKSRPWTATKFDIVVVVVVVVHKTRKEGAKICGEERRYFPPAQHFDEPAHLSILPVSLIQQYLSSLPSSVWRNFIVRLCVCVCIYRLRVGEFSCS